MYVQNYGQYGQRWLKGRVVTLRGPVSALVEMTDRELGDILIKCESGNRRNTSTPTVSRDYLPESFLPSGSDELVVLMHVRMRILFLKYRRTPHKLLALPLLYPPLREPIRPA